VILPDDLVRPRTPLLDRMLKVHERYGRSVLASIEVAREDAVHYGMIEPEPVDEDLVRIMSIVEKPEPRDAPSTLAAIGRYVFTPEIFDALRETPPGHGGEIQLTDAINLLAQEQAVYAVTFEGRFDVGNKLDYLRATVEFALEREDLGADFKAYLAGLVRREKLD
jgi:UTP--glucose-1-phosphate uridylyltransferase